MLLKDLKPNPDNPRTIRAEKFAKLVEMVRLFPRMLELRPIVYDSQDNNLILGGNQRYRALQQIGYTEIPDEWVMDAHSLSCQEKRQFILLDNRDMGEDDYDLLASWETDLLHLADINVPDGISQEISIDKFEVKYNVIIECTDEAHQAEVLEKLEKEGLVCRPLML